jgi:hypothetical protein
MRSHVTRRRSQYAALLQFTGICVENARYHRAAAVTAEYSCPVCLLGILTVVRDTSAGFLQTIKDRSMEKLSAEDALEARRLADQLGLRKLSDHDLVKLLNAARVADMRRDALDISGLTPADEPALVLRLPATGQSL